MCRICAVKFTKLLADSGTVFGAYQKEIYLSSVQTVWLRFLLTDVKQLTLMGVQGITTLLFSSSHNSGLCLKRTMWHLWDCLIILHDLMEKTLTDQTVFDDCQFLSNFRLIFVFLWELRKQQFKQLVLPSVQCPLLSLSVAVESLLARRGVCRHNSL